MGSTEWAGNLSGVGRHWRVYRTFWVSSLARELEFRANFVAKLLQNATWVGFSLLVLLAIYRNTSSIASWGRGEAFILVATCFAMSALFSALFFSLMEIPEHIRKGTLDYILTKPINSQFWVSMRRFNFDRMGALFAGIAMLAIGLTQTGLHPSLLQWFAYVTLIGCAITIFYSANLIMMTTAIWLVRVDNLWVLGETVLDIARYPVDIFPMSVRRAFTYGIPVAFLATVPATQLTRGLDLGMVGLGLLWAAIGLLVSSAFWRYATNNYASASS